MAVGLAAPRSNSARVDPHDHHHTAHSHSHNQHKATHSTSHRSHSHWWHFGQKKAQPQEDEVTSSVSTSTGHHHNHHSAAAAKARYVRHHTMDSIPAIPEHRPTAFSKRGSVTLLQHEDPRTVTKRKRIVLHAIFKC